MILFLQATFQGLSLGAVYSLVAIGLVLIYKATDVLSFAQPALAVAGAGIISFLAVDRGLSFWIALPLGIFITGILGLVIERTFLRAMVGEPVFSVAILTIGIDILIRTVLDDWIGLNPRYMGDSFSMMGNFGSLNIGGVSLKYLELTALVAAIVVIALLSIFFKFSKYGLAMRATSFDQEASLAQGINVGRVIALVWFIAAMLASLSGFFITGGFNRQYLHFDQSINCNDGNDCLSRVTSMKNPDQVQAIYDLLKEIHPSTDQWLDQVACHGRP